jgi:hypothetical protein
MFCGVMRDRDPASLQSFPFIETEGQVLSGYLVVIRFFCAARNGGGDIGNGGKEKCAVCKTGYSNRRLPHMIFQD